MFVKCGHCKACMMEKANRRKNRIQAELKDGFIYLFVTLTYDRMSCPYVYLDDILNKVDYLNVYRAHTTRIVPCTTSDGSIVYRNRRVYKETVLDTRTLPDYSRVNEKRFCCLKKFGARVGVCYYDDLKNFIKRLRINLERNYEYTEKIKFFACSELGEHTQRPHFHLLILTRGCDEQIVRDAICKSWPFAYRYRTEKYIEVARNAASYVSTYVNCTTSIHPFLSSNFKPKHSYSKLFGFGKELFSLDSVLELLRRKDLSFVVGTSGTEPRLFNIPLPKYVINRYFPIFKGLNALSDDEVLQFVLCPQKYESVTFRGCDDKMRPIAYRSETLLSRLKDTSIYCCEPKVSYSPEDLHKIIVRLDNAFKYYHNKTGRGRLDFALDYIDVWRCYKFTSFRLWRCDENVHELYKFYNLIDLINGVVKDSGRCDYYDSLIQTGRIFIVDPNNFPQNISKDRSLSWLFDVKDKTRKVTNYVMSENGHFV